MNAKEFYRAIGQIDEELILAAGERSEKRKKHAVRRCCFWRRSS